MEDKIYKITIYSGSLVFLVHFSLFSCRKTCSTFNIFYESNVYIFAQNTEQSILWTCQTISATITATETYFFVWKPWMSSVRNICMRAWEEGQLRKTHAQCMRDGSPAVQLASCDFHQLSNKKPDNLFVYILSSTKFAPNFTKKCKKRMSLAGYPPDNTIIV